MSIKELKEYENQKKNLKDKIVQFLKKNKGKWVSEEILRENLEFDLEYIDIDEALTGEYWSVRKRIENKSVKVERDGYYEWLEYYRYKPITQSKKILVLIILIIVIFGVLLFHLSLI